MNVTRHVRSPIMHRIVEHGDTLYLGGMTAADSSGGIARQTTQILNRMDELLRECGSDRSKVISATVFVTNLTLKKEMDEVWVAFFGAEHLPARATIGGVTLGSSTTLIEVTCIAST